MTDPNLAGKPVEQMPETPSRVAHHRRTQSETFFPFPDEENLLDDVVADFNFATIDLPSLSSDAPVPTARKAGTHLRSLSVGSDFFDEIGLSSDGAYRCRDGNSFEGDSNSVLMLVDHSKKALAPDKLAELSLIDPKRAKRILANRQSAARSKERKMRYTSELEKKVQTLQTEATTLSAQVTKLQRETNDITTENKELKFRLEAMEQHAHLRDALNEALREEVNRLKREAGQPPLLNGMNYNSSFPPQYSSQMPNSNSISQLKPTFMDFN